MWGLDVVGEWLVVLRDVAEEVGLVVCGMWEVDCVLGECVVNGV